MPDNKFMKTIGENLNVINTGIGAAFKAKDPGPVREMAEQLTAKEVDYIDINLGPARRDGEELMTWVVETVQEVTDTPVALDTSNIEAIRAGLTVCKNQPIINSIMARPERYNEMLPMCAEANAHMIALLWGPEGLPRDENERANLATELLFEAVGAGIPLDQIWVDPIITPVNIQQDQLMSTLHFMEMLTDITDAIDPDSAGALSTCGLSNASNGVPDELRPIINQTFMIMLQRKGMYSCIVDGFDDQIMSICRGERQDIVDLVFGVMDEQEFDYSTMDKEAADYVKTAKVILGQTIFSDSWLEI